MDLDKLQAFADLLGISNEEAQALAERMTAPIQQKAKAMNLRFKVMPDAQPAQGDPRLVQFINALAALDKEAADKLLADCLQLAQTAQQATGQPLQANKTQEPYSILWPF